MPNSYETLRQLLTEAFNEEELKVICFARGIEYDDLEGATRLTKIVSLIKHLGRTGSLVEFVAWVKEERPNYDWPEVPAIWTNPLIGAEVQYTLSKREQKERQKQLVLLEKVKRFWVSGVLAQMIPDDRLLALRRQLSLELIDHPWQDIVGAAVYDTYTVDSYTNILEVFVETDRALLILGEPGSGKTTTLLELARELITLTEQDPSQPIPVVLNLSSWVKDKVAIREWVLTELTAKYQIPRKTAQPWIEEDKLILLLDGLDEVPYKERVDCIQAINHFRVKHGLTAVAVSSRTNEYETIGIQLKLGGAILLQALTAEQIDQYISSFGSQLSSLRLAIQQDPVLQEMAQSPLMLRIMTVAYQDVELSTIGAEGTAAADYHQQLFATYVERMLGRQDDAPYSAEQTKQWLTWLATEMTEHNQTMFLIEQIQPSWIPNRYWRWLYLLCARLVTGFFIAIVVWLVILIGQQINADFSVKTFIQIGNLIQLPPTAINFVVAQILMLALGFVVGVIDGFHFEQNTKTADLNRKASNRRRTLIVALTVMFFAFSTILLFDPIELAVFATILVGFSFSISSLQLDGSSFRDEIRTVEALGWSWQQALRKGVLYGSISAVIVGSLVIQLFEEPLFWPYVLAHTAVGLLLGGLQNNKLERKSYPNQGIWLSIRNGLIAGTLFSLLVGTIFGLSLGLMAGLAAGGALGLMAGLIYGIAIALKHAGVRFLLWVDGQTPIYYTNFLNYAARRVLLHKVGGGYLFMHRLLQDYFSTRNADKHH